MAVNRVVLQHFSLNLEELAENREPRLSTSSTDDDNHPYGHMSDSSSELSENSKHLMTHSSSEFDGTRPKSCSVHSSVDLNDSKIIGKNRVIGKDSLQNWFGLSPPTESRLMQRRLKARSDLLERQTGKAVIASPSGWEVAVEPITFFRYSITYLFVATWKKRTMYNTFSNGLGS